MIEYFSMALNNYDVEVMAKVVNQGIDSRLEAFTKSTFTDGNMYNRVRAKIHPDEMSVLLRRLTELWDDGSDRAGTLADDIVWVYYGKETV